MVLDTSFGRMVANTKVSGLLARSMGLVCMSIQRESEKMESGAKASGSDGCEVDRIGYVLWFAAVAMVPALFPKSTVVFQNT